MIEWSESLELNIEIIDKQHKEIFEEINKLITSFETQNEKDQAYDTLCFIEEYVNKHFKTEEFYLKKYEYNELKEQEEMHNAFSKHLSDYKTYYKKGGLTKKAALEMNEFLIKWWDNHILKVDSKYVDWLSEKIKDTE